MAPASAVRVHLDTTGSSGPKAAGRDLPSRKASARQAAPALRRAGRPPLRGDEPRCAGDVLTVNGGSSSIKFALFETGGRLTAGAKDRRDVATAGTAALRPTHRAAAEPAALRRVLHGKIDGIGQGKGTFEVRSSNAKETFSRRMHARDHNAAVTLLMDWAHRRIESGELAAIGHRIVHGGPKHSRPERFTSELIRDLRELTPFDPQHLPEEILLAEAFHRRFPKLPQVACFDTAFHHELPRVAQLLPIPRRFEKRGVRRYGFHGISYAYLMRELERTAGAAKAKGRIVLAHLGNGASLAAVSGGKPVDTSMGFTPSAGVPMSTRSGDLDPGLVWYLSRAEHLDAKGWNKMVNFESGLLGLSERSSDMRDLVANERKDKRAAEAAAVFCYQVKKWIGAFAAALGGLDVLVFSGGIGEHAAPVRARICEGLGFLGVQIDSKRNARNAEIISRKGAKVSVRVIPTDEELMIAETVCEVLGLQVETSRENGR